MMTEQLSRNLVGPPCEDSSVDAAAYKRDLIAAVKKAEQAIERGAFMTLEELEKEYYSWNFE